MDNNLFWLHKNPYEALTTYVMEQGLFSSKNVQLKIEETIFKKWFHSEYSEVIRILSDNSSSSIKAKEYLADIFIDRIGIFINLVLVIRFNNGTEKRVNINKEQYRINL